MAVDLARLIGLEEESLIQLRRGGLLHDVGKLGVPDHVLLKPGPLTDEEWKIMRMHPQFAYDWLSPIAYLRKAVEIPYNHHEKWDGSGYPRGLKGDAIPLMSRIFALADVWDALTSNRPYRSAWPPEKAIQYIRENSGTHFDPALVEVFLKYITVHIASHYQTH
jgi:HD-GYP domain-containing protein (c-di-GMP phosphodiesterase class II)